MPTQAEIGRHIDLSPRHVRELRDLGVISTHDSLAAIRVAYIAHLRAEKGGHGSASLTAARARREAAAAQREELKLARERNALVDRAALETAFGEVMTRFRKQVMAIHKTAVTTLGLTATQSRKLGELHERCLNQLSRFDFGRSERNKRNPADGARRQTRSGSYSGGD